MTQSVQTPLTQPSEDPAPEAEPITEAAPESQTQEVAAEDASVKPVATPVGQEDAPDADPVPIDLSAYLPNENGAKLSVTVGAFADFGLYLDDNFESSELEIGQLVFHTAAQLSEDFSTFAELSLGGDDHEGVASIHRLLFRWESSDALTISAGRYHLPLTWWNATVHHGVWLQTTTERPSFLDYGNSFVPNHATGAFLAGQLPALRQLGIRYNVAVSSGHMEHAHGGSETEMGMTGMTGMSMPTPTTTTTTGTTQTGQMIPSTGELQTVQLTYNAVLAVEPRAIPHLRVGVGGLSGPMVATNQSGKTTAGSAHVAYTSERPELIVEGILVSNAYESHGGQAGGHPSAKVYQSVAGYAQAAYRLRILGERLKPYTRYEQLNIQDLDPTMATFTDYKAIVGGLRIDLIPTLALKTQARHETTPNKDGNGSGAIQLSAAW
ncbi:MAG: hypothetical protein GWP91_04595 [Rhodobacterales bacterium]|nr:hypothetical protein [Rhodobacterales bacterium]